MSKYKIEIFVFFFLLVVFFSFLFILLRVSTFDDFNTEVKYYKVTAMFKHVGNLKKKSKVTICGTKIGFVNKIVLKKNFNNEYYSEVEILISRNINEIPIDSSINILMSNLLGDSYIQIDIGNDSKFFIDGDKAMFTTQALSVEELISKFALK